MIEYDPNYSVSYSIISTSYLSQLTTQNILLGIPINKNLPLEEKFPLSILFVYNYVNSILGEVKNNF